MTAQRISIDGWWTVTALYDVWPQDMGDVEQTLRKAGAPQAYVGDAAANLSGWNAGYTFSNMARRMSVVCIGRATSLREFLNTIDHEEDHVQAHIAEYYGVRLGTEQAAYLQGYIGGRMLEFVVKVVLK